MMNAAHLDTHSLIAALRALTAGKGVDVQAAAGALELCNLLMVFDQVKYDRAVNLAIARDVDDAMTEAVKQFGGEFRRRFVGVTLSRDYEEKAVDESIAEAAPAVLEKKDNALFRSVLQLPFPAQSPDDPDTHLFKPLQHSGGLSAREIDELWGDRSVRGHRLYCAIHRNAIARQLVLRDIKAARRRLPHLFTMFRIQFAENRAFYDAKYEDHRAGTFCYYPQGDRRTIVERTRAQLARVPNTTRDKLLPALRALAISTATDTELIQRTSTFPLPPLAGLLLQDETLSRAKLVGAALEFGDTRDGRRIRRAIDDFRAGNPEEQEEILKTIPSLAFRRARGGARVSESAVITGLTACAKAVGAAVEEYFNAENKAGVRGALAKGIKTLASEAGGEAGHHLAKLLGRKLRVGTVLSHAVAADAKALADRGPILDLFNTR